MVNRLKYRFRCNSWSWKASNHDTPHANETPARIARGFFRTAPDLNQHEIVVKVTSRTERHKVAVNCRLPCLSLRWFEVGISRAKPELGVLGINVGSATSLKTDNGVLVVQEVDADKVFLAVFGLFR